MKRHRRTETEAADHDSFLDIVANIVGILIILVMVVGVRAREAPVLSIGAAKSEDNLQQKLSHAQSEAASLERDILESDAKSQQLHGTMQLRQRERNYLATLIASGEAAIDARRSALDDVTRDSFDRQRQLAEKQARLNELNQKSADAQEAPKETVEVKTYPTPLSKTVFGREVHFQIRGGLVAHLPIEQLFEDAKAEAREKVWKLNGLPETTDIVGPIEGFRMRYTLEKLRIPPEVSAETGQGGYMIRSKRWELLPTASRLGEPVAQALAPGSRLGRVLARLDPQTTTITLWVYPDSFDAYRELKAELFGRGFAVAGRPLPEGAPIGGSPQGTRSSAQ